MNLKFKIVNNVKRLFVHNAKKNSYYVDVDAVNVIN